MRRRRRYGDSRLSHYDRHCHIRCLTSLMSELAVACRVLARLARNGRVSARQSRFGRPVSFVVLFVFLFVR
jgi:hypothetical protein